MLGDGRGAGIGLLIGMGLVATLIALAGASPRAFHGIYGDADGIKTPAGVYVDGWVSGTYNPLSPDRWSWATAIATIFYIGAVWVIGAALLRVLPGIRQWPTSVRIAGGFLPGYVVVLLPLQLVYAALPAHLASWLALAAVLGTAGALVGGGVRRVTTSGYRASVHALAIGLAVAVGAIGLSMVHRLQAGRNFMVPDSISIFLQTLGSPTGGLSVAGRLLQWDQQSDEWLFSAPVNLGPGAIRAALLPFFVTEAAGLVSFAALVFGLVWAVARRRRILVAGIATGAVLFITPQIVPWYYLSLVGGQNPAGWLGHPGRYVGIVAPWVALCVAMHWSRGSSRTLVALLCAGVGFVSIHAGFYIGVSLALFAAWVALRDVRSTWLGRRAGEVSLTIAAVASLLAPMVAYGLVGHVADPSRLVTPLLFGALFAAAGFAVVAASDPPGIPRVTSWQPLRALVLVSASIAVGLLLSGNMTSGLLGGRLRAWLGVILPGYDAPVASRGLVGTDQGFLATFPSFQGAECSISAHCLGFGGYLLAYGMLIVLAGATWLALGRSRPGSPALVARGAWLALVGLLALGFVLVDFTGGGIGTSWVLTRFLEVPYYALIAIAAIVLVGSRSRFTAAVASGILVIWTIVPLVSNLVVVQWLVNTRFLLDGIGG